MWICLGLRELGFGGFLHSDNLLLKMWWFWGIGVFRGAGAGNVQLMLHNRIVHQSKDMVSETSAVRIGAKMQQVFVISPYFFFNHRWKGCKSIPFIGYNANIQVGLWCKLGCKPYKCSWIAVPVQYLRNIFQPCLGKWKVALLVAAVTALEMGGYYAAVWSREAFPPLENQSCVCAAQVSADLRYSWLTLKPLGCVSASYTSQFLCYQITLFAQENLSDLGICWENRGAWRVRWLRRNGKGGILCILKHYGRL